MRLTFLGTGTSMGIPVIGCTCAVCTSTDARNRRLRTSALLEVAGQKILIDAGPDLRQQALAAAIRHIDAVLFTHAHFDHIAGIDDLRPLNFAQQGAIPLYGSATTLAYVRERFSYAFANESEGSSRPMLELVPIQAGQPFAVGGVPVLPFDIMHGTWTITGYRIGRLGYVTDASAIPDAARQQLRGLDLLVLNTLRREPHPTHLSLSQSLEVIAELQPLRALLVHMTHDLDHAATSADLPSGVQLAYDGLTVELDEHL